MEYNDNHKPIVMNETTHGYILIPWLYINPFVRDVSCLRSQPFNKL